MKVDMNVVAFAYLKGVHSCVVCVSLFGQVNHQLVFCSTSQQLLYITIAALHHNRKQDNMYAATLQSCVIGQQLGSSI